ncbi:MAG: CobD [Hyphomicrobiales bacterium]|nr:CobD [Hyphomicrobiales bacterium]
MHLLIAPLALLLERLFGYPQRLVKAIGHPVIWYGKLIDFLEIRLNQPKRSGAERKFLGVIMLALLLLAALLPTMLIAWTTNLVPFGWIIDAVLATAFLAQKELGRAVRLVADALSLSLLDGRIAVNHIVGRDPQVLDEAGVARAAIESLAESSSDGVIAPLFWLAIFGLPGIALYKAINTADSMVGHRNERYSDFGWASARLDDVVNWIPARLAALLLAGASFLVKGADPEKSWSTALRDARKHASPNAGWPEAALAGALGFSLGGPRSYDGEMVDLPPMGVGQRDLAPADILKALDLYRMMLNLALGVCVAVAVLAWGRV